MAPSRNPRNYRRVSQACSNCRRKKTRCPGERPACSHCVRLRQNCEYLDNQRDRQAWLGSKSRLEDRVAQLEEMILNKSQGLSQQNETPESTTASYLSPTGNLETSATSLLPPNDIIALVIHAYYEYAHRQPLWLFERDDALNSDCCEELLLTILSIAAQHSSTNSFREHLHSAETYSDAARSMIMLRIASASVDMRILQALCLLSFSNLLLNDLDLASFHAMLAKTLLQSSGLASQLSPERSAKFEEQRRLIWSIFILDLICGQQQKTPSLNEDIHNPRYFMIEGTQQRTSSQCPSLPQESHDNNEERSIGIWAHMAGMISLWSEATLYVSKCAEGISSTPWKSDSTYTNINSHIMDQDTTFPDCHRFDAAKFSERSVADIAAQREYWLPWMRVQINFHLIHCILNHPFLLSSSKPKQNVGTNNFWKSASQLALLHSTWISRLLEMSKEKGLQLSDPIFTYAAVVATTLHTYWSRASDATVRSSARRYSELCRTFVTEWGPQWSVCQSMAKLLDEYLCVMLSAQPIQRSREDTDKVKASAIWNIFSFAYHRPQCKGKGLFQPSFIREQELYTGERRDVFTFDDPNLDPTPIDVQNNSHEYAAPPNLFFSPNTSGSVEQQEISQGNHECPKDQTLEKPTSLPNGDATNFPSFLDWTWTSDGTQGFHSSDLGSHEQSSVNLDWWDTGIL